MTTPDNDHGLEFVDPDEFESYDDVDSTTVPYLLDGVNDYVKPADDNDDAEMGHA